MTRISLRLRAGLIALASLSAPIVATPAQQPMVFVHGGMNDATAWYPTADWLMARYAIQPVIPTLGWTDPFATQEQRLYNAIAGYTAIPALAHSNGGLVSRQHVRARGSGSRIDRLATIGTPHGGLPLAANALDGNVGAWAQGIIGSIGDPIYFYSNADPDWWWAEPIGLESAAYNMQRFGDFIPFAVLNGLGVGSLYPVTYDLRPGSGFLTGLNSPQELSVEASVLRARVGITTTTRPQNAMMRLLLSNWQTWTNIRWSLYSFAIIMRDYYDNHWDYYLRANAWRWDALALYMIDLDVVWQWQIGTLRYAVCSPGWCYAEVYANDGLVPLASQTYPGATRTQTNGNDIVHTQQKNPPTARQNFWTVLRYDFGVPDAPPPPPASLQVSISGPSGVRANLTCQWHSTISGGSGPYTYSWTKNGSVLSSDGDVITSFSSSATLYLQVTDGGGQSSTVSKSVSVSSSNPTCPPLT